MKLITILLGFPIMYVLIWYANAWLRSFHDDRERKSSITNANYENGPEEIHIQTSNAQAHYRWKEAQGNGYAKVAAQTFFHFGKTSLYLNQMIALVQPQNTVSIQVVQSLPMQLKVEANVNGQQVHVYSDVPLKDL